MHEPTLGVIAYNPATDGRRELRGEDLTEAWRWAYAGVTFHWPHLEVCSHSPGGPRRPGQDRLAF